MFINQTAGLITTIASGDLLSRNGDMSPLSSSNSFSSVDTNQTLLNSIANQTQMQHQQQKQHQHQHQHQNQHHHHRHQQQSSSHNSMLPQLPPPTNNTTSSISSIGGSSNRHHHIASNRSYRTKYGQFMIITPAVSIDRDYEHDEAFGSGGSAAAALTNNFDFDEDVTYCNDNTNMTITNGVNNDNGNPNNSNTNGNLFRMSLLQNSSSIDSGNSSDSSSFRSNYNPYLHHSRQHLLPKTTAPHFYTFSSWRWCTLICAAMRCFGGGGHSSHAPYSTSFARPPYQRSRSGGAQTTSKRSSQPHRRLRSSSFTAETAFEHFSAPFKARKTRDHLNNITYEL